MEKNAILAIVISVVILLLWQQLFIAPQQQKLQEERARQEEIARQERQTGEGTNQSPVGQVQEAVSVEGVLPSTEFSPQQLDENAKDIIIETPRIHAIITTQGARVKSWKLLEHKDTNGEPVEFVSPGSRQRGQYPLAVFTGDASLDEELNTGLYESSITSLQLEPGDESATLSLTYKLDNGGIFTKQFLFHEDSFKMDTTLKFSEPSQVGNAISVVWGPGLGADLRTPCDLRPE